MTRARIAAAVAAALFVAACGGGGGGGGIDPKCGEIDVCTGFFGDLDWEASGPGGPGAGGDGGGGAGAGGALGQFRRALVVVTFPDGKELGRALTDEASGMVTVRPGRTYDGPLLIEIIGQPDAEYFDEGRQTFLPFGPDQRLRALIPRVTKNIGVTPFTEAAYQLALKCHEGFGPPAVCDGPTARAIARTASIERKALPSVAHIVAANERVKQVLNEQVPSTLQIDDVTRLPFIVNDRTGPNAISTTQRGRYGLVNIAFSKQAAMYSQSGGSPTLLATRQLSNDLQDGRLDGQVSGVSAANADRRTYDPATLTTEMSSALAQQTSRYGDSGALAALPKVVSFGNTRYDDYFFDTRITPAGTAATVAVATEGEPTRTPGQVTPYVTGSEQQRGYAVFANMGSGALFIKTDIGESRSKIVAIGDNLNGELGIGTRGDPRGPAEVQLPGVVTHMAGGLGHTIARLADGTVFAWGDNSYGQLGQGIGGGSLARSETPLRVNLPGGAVAVAAANASSFALMENGQVYSWGSAWGFGTVGDGTASGQRLTPAPVLSTVGELTGIVQLAARDNDVVVLKNDGSVWTWGSFTTTVDNTSELLGISPGRLVATPVEGLPSTGTVRKVLTEQGLFAALMSDGALYSWGIYFDLTFDGVLRDLTPVRVLNLPSARDMMPGGYLGYGQRPFDRMTAMALDYDGGMWRIRGRVAERYDINDPTAVRRPPTKIRAFDKDCAACHVVPPKTLPPLPTSGPDCRPRMPPWKFDDAGNPLLINSGTVCAACHNGGLRGNGSGAPIPVLDCVPPSPLPDIVRIITAPLTTGCQLDTTHVGLPPGSTCATCHSSVIAAPLKCTVTAQTDAPPLPTTATITAIVDDLGPTQGVVANGGSTDDTTPTVQGLLSGSLLPGEVVEVLRSGVKVGNASVNGTAWAIVDPQAPAGSHVYTARVASPAAFGPRSSGYAIVVDLGQTQKFASIERVEDNAPPNPDGSSVITIASGGATNDTTPTLIGTLSAALGAGESLQISRTSGTSTVVLAPPVVSGTGWQLTDTGLVNGSAYLYVARVIGSNGIAGAASNTYAIEIDSSVPSQTVNIAAILDNVGPVQGTVPRGGTTDDVTPTLTGTVSAVLTPGQVLRVLRDGQLRGNATFPLGGTNWEFTDSGGAVGSRTYTAVVVSRTGIAGTVSVNPYGITLQTTAPTTIPIIQSYVDNQGEDQGTYPDSKPTDDRQPVLVITVPQSIGPNDTVQVRRQIGGADADGNAVPVSGLWQFAENVLLPAGATSYTARIVSGAGIPGEWSNAFQVVVDLTPPAATATAALNPRRYPTRAGNPFNGTVPSFSNDAVPQVQATVSGLGSGDRVQLRRQTGATFAEICQWTPTGTTCVPGATVSVSGNVWTFTDVARMGSLDATPVGGIAETYQVRILDAAGNLSASAPQVALTLNYPLCNLYWPIATSGSTPAHGPRSGAALPAMADCSSCHGANVTGTVVPVPPSIAMNPAPTAGQYLQASPPGTFSANAGYASRTAAMAFAPYVCRR